MTTIIAFVSQKGGVGKSTLSRALAREAAIGGLRTKIADQYDLLIIDGPARTSTGTLEIARVADLVVQPTGASVDDLRPAIREFHALLQAGVTKDKLTFALNRIGTPTEEDAARHRQNVIIRPRSTTATLIQLDDLDFAKAERIAPRAFLVFQTSPVNYQAWVGRGAGSA